MEWVFIRAPPTEDFAPDRPKTRERIFRRVLINTGLQAGDDRSAAAKPFKRFSLLEPPNTALKRGVNEIDRCYSRARFRRARIL